MDCICHLPSPLGELLLASDGESLTGLGFVGQAHCAAGLDPLHTERSLPVFEVTARWLASYFAGQVPATAPPLRPRGTTFQKSVWAQLAAIPRGETRTYGDLARLLSVGSGKPVSARAVGGAVGRNPISILLPCHRVLSAGGKLTGYAGGLARKRALLAHEAGDPGPLRQFGP